MKKEIETLKISLLSDRVLVLPQNAKSGEQKTSSGIILQKKDEDQKIEIGKIVAIGNGRRINDGTRIPLDVKVGDKVYFKRGYDVEEITLEDTKYVLLAEASVYAIIN
jgi:chaperonin GroES